MSASVTLADILAIDRCLISRHTPAMSCKFWPEWCWIIILTFIQFGVGCDTVNFLKGNKNGSD